ncbi:MAG: RcnB family protein [Pseudomonadota bacterium]|nr:RcnB family protein [Pseudomonadota bacterium]
MPHGQMPMRHPQMHQMQGHQMQGHSMQGRWMQGHGMQHRHNWGGMQNGRWSGGWNAPGGWNAYHRPSRGWRLPSYWIAPNFFIDDCAGYGLSAPPEGYRWSRYYDDAVLVDGGGQVWDSVGGMNWGDGDDGVYGDDEGYGAGYPPPPGGPGAGYGDYHHGRGPGYAPPPVRVIQVPPMTQGYTTVYAGGVGYGGGYYYPPATTTVITIQSQPVVTTTTTTEYVTERTVARRWAAPKRHWRPAPKPRCSCRPAPKPKPRILGS